MDKIRILRSSRKKTSRGKAKGSSPGMASVSIPQPVVAESTQQWVPVLVLDISKTENTAFPVNSTVTNTLPVKQCQVVESCITTRSKPSELKTSPVKNAPITTIIPVTSSISLTCSTSSIPSSQKDLPKNVQAKDIIPVPETEPSLVATEGNTYENTPFKDETDDSKDGTSGDNPVKCVLCDKTFPSLKEMQVHYLSTHKSRKGREGRKRSVEHTETLSSSSTSSHLPGMGWEENLKDISDSGTGEPVCPVCRIAFKTTAEVKDHVKQVHAYVCSECNSTFYTLFQFTDHKCNKGNKRVKKVKKKVTGEAKLIYNFVEVKPNCKQKKKSTTGESSTTSSLSTIQKESSPIGRDENDESDSPVPELIPSTLSSNLNQQEPFHIQAEVLNPTVNAVQINFNKKEYKKKAVAKQASKAEQPSTIKSKKKKAVANARVKSASKRTHEKCSNDSLTANASSQTTYCEPHITDEPEPDLVNEQEFLPSIATTYTLKDSAEDDTNVTRDQKKITVIETCNIHQAKKMVTENEIPLPNVSTKDVIRQKIDELKSNPNVSISWLPTLRLQCQDDGDFVCGRCNVICDDMEDYMDHIQDCLTITSVTLEPTSNPPRRFLRLRNEISTLRYQEPNNNRYSVNRNLINKLQSVLPEAKEYLTVSSQSNKMYNSGTIGISKPSRQTFKDLLDDDFGHECINSPLPVCPVEGMREHSGKVLPRNLQRFNHTSVNNIATKVSVSNAKVTQPMVMIPVDHKSKHDTCLIIAKDQARLEVSEKVEEAIGCASALASHSFTPSSTAMIHSPLDMLLDPDEIKMEVEEEVVDDHYEVSQFAISYTCWV